MKHMQGYVPDNPRYAPLTVDEMRAMFCDDWLAGTACETCAHRVTIDCGKELFKGYELTSKTVQDTCGDWDMGE